MQPKAVGAYLEHAKRLPEETGEHDCVSKTQVFEHSGTRHVCKYVLARLRGCVRVNVSLARSAFVFAVFVFIVPPSLVVSLVCIRAALLLLIRRLRSFVLTSRVRFPRGFLRELRQEFLPLQLHPAERVDDFIRRL